ncbi:MAG: hypothetical protein HQK75_00055 [Candidatus Magnetomorum sp.]|nr:hypothetical protein [Candidatus Magnetomorum sp.]
MNQSKQESLYIVPIRFFTGLMIILFGLSICATYADAGLIDGIPLEERNQIQVKSPVSIRVYPLPDRKHFQICWQSVGNMAAGYAIYKNGILFDTSIEPGYIDEWPDRGSSPIYEITAYDIHGNESQACTPFTIHSYEEVSTGPFHEASVPVAKRPEKAWTR